MTTTAVFPTNDRAALAFSEIAEYLELRGENRFKIKAYVKAASVLRQLETDLASLRERDALETIPGVGKAIAEKLESFLEHGTIPLLEELRAEIPVGLLAVSNLAGLGPKKTALLHKELGVTSLDDLREALSTDKVSELKGFSKRMQEKLLLEVERAADRVPTYLKSQAEKWSQQILESLKDLVAVENVSVVGEVRRKVPETTQIDILVVTSACEQTEKALAERLESEKTDFVVGDGSFELQHPSGCPVKVSLCLPSDAPWEMMNLTGPPELVDHIKALSQTSDQNQPTDETSMLNYFGIINTAPEVRHRQDLWSSVPVELIEVSHILGNLHAHSTDSDGQESFEAMVSEALRRGHSYYGVTDHSRSLVIANGLTVERLLEQAQRVKTWNQAHHDFDLFMGNECDILEDGTLDYPDDVLEQLDYVVGAVHSMFHLDGRTMTDRLLRGLQHPKVKIWAHPTGRLIGKREGYVADWKVVFDHCAKHEVAIEINANPRRLDLSESLLDLAVDAGCFIAINTDAHSLGEFANLRHGVDMARRAGLSKDRVINTWPAERLKTWFAAS